MNETRTLADRLTYTMADLGYRFPEYPVPPGETIVSMLANPEIWLQAAGQVFFTLSVGMGSIQCYAAYLKDSDDIALNAASAGSSSPRMRWMLPSGKGT